MFTAMLSARTVTHNTELVGDPKSVALHSFTLSMNDVYLLATFIALVGIPICFLVRKKAPAQVLEMKKATSA